MKRGDIYLVDFGQRYQSNIGKIKPAVIMSADEYLEIIPNLTYQTILVIPLTTQCVNDKSNLLRVSVTKREKLQKQSEVIVNWACSVDCKNMDLTTEVITSLTLDEMHELDYKFSLFCGL